MSGTTRSRSRGIGGGLDFCSLRPATVLGRTGSSLTNPRVASHGAGFSLPPEALAARFHPTARPPSPPALLRFTLALISGRQAGATGHRHRSVVEATGPTRRLPP